MARVIYSERALSDFERIFDFVAAEDPALATATVGVIRDAVMILERHPFIGRPVEHELRELVISRAKTGYVALYSYHELDDTILVLTFRHQRAAGYEHL